MEPPTGWQPRRIAVIGCPGAGKSTLSRALGERLALPVIHLDRLHWRPGWVEPPDDEWAETVREAASGEVWIIDGNYNGTIGIRVAAADTVVFLDFPRRVCYWHIVKRWARYRGQERPDMGEGCPERLDWGFLTWVWNYPRLSRPKTLRLLTTGRQSRVFVLHTTREVEDFLEIVAGKQEAAG